MRPLGKHLRTVILYGEWRWKMVANERLDRMKAYYDALSLLSDEDDPKIRELRRAIAIEEGDDYIYKEEDYKSLLKELEDRTTDEAWKVYHSLETSQELHNWLRRETGWVLCPLTERVISTCFNLSKGGEL